MDGYKLSWLLQDYLYNNWPVYALMISFHLILLSAYLFSYPLLESIKYLKFPFQMFIVIEWEEAQQLLLKILKEYQTWV